MKKNNKIKNAKDVPPRLKPHWPASLPPIRLGMLGKLLLIAFVMGTIWAGVSLVEDARQNLAANTIPAGSAKVWKAKKAHRRRAAHNINRRLLAQADIDQSQTSDIATLCGFVAPEKPEYKGEFIALETEAQVQEGKLFEASIYIKNTGNMPWTGDLSGCGGNAVRLGTGRVRDRASVFYNPADGRWINASRIAMVERRVDPGEIATFTFSSYAPYVSDIFREYFQPVVENTQWIEGKGTIGHINIFVGDIDSENERRLFYLGTTGQASSLDISGEPAIDVDISEQKMRVKFGETLVREYLVSTGTFSTPTPYGRFKILNKQTLRIGAASPHYRMPFWQGFTSRGHGLHALPYLANDEGVFWDEALNHIGQRVSHGCVRLLNEDAEDLYNLADVGMAIVIHE